MTLGRCRSAGLCAGAILLASAGVLWAQRGTPSAQSPPATTRFFPVAVWYGGGKARAPMIDRQARPKKEIWRKDVRQIKALGFNTVRAWIDWASGEPAEGRYDFETLDVLLELAEEEGLKLVLQVYMDSAPQWVGENFPDSLFVSSNGQAIRPESSPGYCRDHPGVRTADNAFYSALAHRARRSPAFLGMGPLERAARHQLGQPDVDSEPGVLLLPPHHPPLPWLASGEVRLARETE